MENWRFNFWFLGLTISPMRRIVGLNLIKFRRAVGVLTFTYVSLHLLVWLVLDVQVPSQIWADILKRPYITVGMAAFVLMLPLAVTSNNLVSSQVGTALAQIAQACLSSGDPGRSSLRHAGKRISD